MYRSDLDSRHKGSALAGVVAVHAALLFALLNLSGTIDLADTQRVLKIIDLTEDPPPPPPPEPPPPPPQQRQVERQKEPEGGAAPENIRSQATPIKRITPRIPLPVPVPVNTSETPAQGTDTTQGAGDTPGPGTGAGGSGTGTGSGSGGSGTGGGGDGGIAVPPGLIRGITQRDYPDAIQRRWPRGGRIFVRLRIEPSGRPSACDVMRGYGDPVAADWTCRLLMERGTFRPARTASGAPVAAWFGYEQRDTGRFGR